MNSQLPLSAQCYLQKNVKTEMNALVGEVVKNVENTADSSSKCEYTCLTSKIKTTVSPSGTSTWIIDSGCTS